MYVDLTEAQLKTIEEVLQRRINQVTEKEEFHEAEADRLARLRSILVDELTLIGKTIEFIVKHNKGKDMH